MSPDEQQKVEKGGEKQISDLPPAGGVSHQKERPAFIVRSESESVGFPLKHSRLLMKMVVL